LASFAGLDGMLFPALRQYLNVSINLMRFIIVIVYLFFVACSNGTNSPQTDKQSSIDDTSKVLSITNSYSVEQALQIVGNFSTSFRSDSSAYEGIGTLKNVPDSVVRAFKVLRHTDSSAHKRYVTVVLLKLYLDHLRCCHQSYEIRENPSISVDSVADPLLYEFVLATKMLGLHEHQEFISSGIALTYVKENNELLRYPEVKQVMSEIKPIEDSIAKGLYWKD